MRRDNCLLVKNVVTTSLEKMLVEKDVDGAVAYVKGVISDLLMNRMDLSLLVVTKVGVEAFSGPGKQNIKVHFRPDHEPHGPVAAGRHQGGLFMKRQS